MSTYTLDEIADRLRRRADGEVDALDGVWADETTSWRSYNHAVQTMTSAQRDQLSRREQEAFTAAMPDFERRSSFHVAPDTQTIMERTTWSGTAAVGPVEVDLCLVYAVEDGRITAVDLFGDADQFDQLGRALRAPAGAPDRFTLVEIQGRLERKVKGDIDALDGVWADEDTVSSHADGIELHCTGAERTARAKVEIAAFEKGIDDFRRESTFDRCEETDRIYELTTVHGSLDGEPFEMRSCAVYTAVDGRLHRVDVYGSDKHIDKIREGLTRAGFFDDESWRSTGE